MLAIKTFRTVIALMAKYDYDIQQLDISSAFLNAKINKSHLVYIKLLKEYIKLGFLKLYKIPIIVAKLNKARSL